jgi:hypothetical protein
MLALFPILAFVYSIYHWYEGPGALCHREDVYFDPE